MRPRGAVWVLLAGLLTGGLLAAVTTPVQARPQPDLPRAVATLTARLAPPLVTVGEPAAIVAQLSTAQPGRRLTVQRRRDNGSWAQLAEAVGNGTGRTAVRLDTSASGPQVLRVVAEAWAGRAEALSRQVTLRVLPAGSCSPRVALVDPDATTAARCLATRLDRWTAAGLMGVGQQLNMSNAEYDAPLRALGERRVSVVGFDLWELGKTKRYEFPFFDRALADLVAMAQDGAVLTASWHAANPHTGQSYDDRSWHDLGALLGDTPEAIAFWADVDEQLTVLAELQAAGVAVVLRPFHEVNGDWFWWGRPSAATFRELWSRMQERAWAAGVHNVVWAYSFAAASRAGIVAPERLLPAAVDLAGIDSYWPSTGSHRGDQAPSMAGYAAVARRVPRMAVTEVGPLADPSGRWRPSLITRIARGQTKEPAWALLWVDDAAGLKQIASLDTGPAWLDSCPNAFCLV